MTPALAKLGRLTTTLAKQRLTITELQVLVALLKAVDTWNSYVTQRDLGLDLGWTKVDTSRTLRSLREKELIVQTRAGQTRNISLTPKGRTFMRNVTDLLES